METGIWRDNLRMKVCRKAAAGRLFALHQYANKASVTFCLYFGQEGMRMFHRNPSGRFTIIAVCVMMTIWSLPLEVYALASDGIGSSFQLPPPSESYYAYQWGA